MTLDFDGYGNIGEAFAERVAAHPGRTALVIVRGSALEDHESLTFAELARRAGVRAAGFAARLAPGERVIIALPTSAEFVEVYLACLFAGLVAVPVPAPDGAAGTGSTRAAERIAGVVGDCAPRLAVTTGGDRERLVAWLRDRGLGHVPVEEVGEAAPGEPAGMPHASARDTLAVLQYSSGSTGTPNGVMLGHGDILADMAAFHAGSGAGPGDAFGIWLPLHHDMGLFGQLTAGLLLGAPVALMPPADFVRRPVDWLRMIERHAATITAAPNFAYELCTRLIPDEHLDGLDLSRLRIVFNGSEPIHVPTVAAFTKRFARTGLRPEAMVAAYGLAEATVFVSGTPLGVPPTVLVADPDRLESAEHPALVATTRGDGKEIIGVGTPPDVFEVRIVDPRTRRRLPDGAIGEIWLRGAAIGRGYWGRTELSASVFAARLAGDDGGPASSGWLRTGDLGALVNGELFVTGRLREMMIVHGRNVFPQDVEQAARDGRPELAGLVGAAFGVSAPDERIVLVHEVAPATPAGELPAVATAVSRRLTAAMGVPVRNVLLVRRGTVHRTTSGKIRRGEMRARFLAGEIDALHAELEPDVQRLIG
ncbi:fatty acyl-AMP ligase [Actinoallomurus iriomotensis]|uniref:Polyketide synthase n=1 Tax=Actinoallomurus iriomotensis TaxID=478107 RepID=A0A9W6VZ84_9ACTN|nr:fatty acyl-AMP ligase [Actinoallomurus iriomotensis]GLY85089.1 polyketide synthase [Actinoallomurus iriomotensis]